MDSTQTAPAVPEIPNDSQPQKTGSPGDSWRMFQKCMSQQDEDLVRGWRDEMDGLLIFSGLFSAVVTTFVVDSYKALQPDPNATTNLLLLQLSAQLGSLSISNGFLNSTVSPASLADISAAVAPTTLASKVNALWIASLIFSLATAAIAIVVRQWLREYLVHPTGTPRQLARIRQLRYNKLQSWGVPYIIATLPVLLQVSLALFLIGLLYQLWDLNNSVAIIATIFTAMTLAFIFGTSLIPGMILDCPYRSLQAYLVGMTLRSLTGCFVLLIVAFLMIPFLLLTMASARSKRVVERFIWNPLVNIARLIFFTDQPRRWNISFDDWKILDTMMDHRTTETHSQLELEVITKVDEAYRGDDIRLAQAMATCIGEMNNVQAANCLVSILSYPRGGHGTLNILLPNVISALEGLNLKDKGTTKRILRIVNRINKTFKHKFIYPDRNILIEYRRIQRGIAERLAHDMHDTCETIPHDPTEPITEMLYTLNNSLIISWFYRETQDMVFDLTVFNVLTHTLTKCPSSRTSAPVFYTSCRQAIRLTLLPNIPEEDLPTIRQSIGELFDTFESCLKKNGLCDHDGTLYLLELCYIPFLVGLFDDLDAFVNRYPDFTERIRKLVGILVDRVSKDVPDTCSPFRDTKPRFINYLEEEHDLIRHSEKKLIMEKGKEWKLKLDSSLGQVCTISIDKQNSIVLDGDIESQCSPKNGSCE
ncbi:hypothetical protein C8Q75DRAFT_166615 [Abortiporus biennis]|nr:hypothetical protein C8Q75DRAFT_166615 [Abortiporus biennis]